MTPKFSDEVLSMILSAVAGTSTSEAAKHNRVCKLGDPFSCKQCELLLDIECLNGEWLTSWLITRNDRDWRPTSLLRRLEKMNLA